MNRSDYKRLGNYIREVDVRNRDLAVTNLLGLSMTKQFRPSTSNIVGVDLSKYKVVNNNVFAFDPMSVIRVHKVPIALNETDSPIIVSPAYITFESIDVDLLNPQYLMMWFRRAEFDRYADFKSDSSVRGGYNWDELCETMVCIPSIERQRAMVVEYETLSRRIDLNRSMIAQLEATAQTLYRKMFVDDIDPEHLPAGWRMGTLEEIVEINPRLFLRKNEMCSFVEMDALPTEGFGIKKVEQKIYSGGTKFQNGDILFARITPCMENGKAAVVMSLLPNEIGAGSTEFIILRGKELQLTGLLSVIVREKGFKIFAKKCQTGSDGRQRVEAHSLRSFPMLIPPTLKLKDIESVFYCILRQSLGYDQENKILTELQSLLLAKMGQ